jgi:3-hydroxymyristoyl/3-hydroxydecanoyl-(acyl carrier protein) dehydratase
MMDNIIKHIEHDGELINFSIDTNHEVFTGHFPQYPILPGVFEMFIIEKVIEYKFSVMLNLINVEIVKFLSPIFPNENAIFSLFIKNHEIIENSIKIDCLIMKEDKIICSFLGIFKNYKL